MTAVTTEASGRFSAVHSSGVRIASQIRQVCIHSTEGDTAEGAASWFANPNSEGSANMVCDDKESFRTLPDGVVPWAAPGLNTSGYHIELAGYAHWTRKEWLAHIDTLNRAAYKAALRCKKYSIPARWVGPVRLRLGWKGLTTHRDVSYAWPLLARPAGFHTDPGPNFPKDIFLQLVKHYLVKL